MGVCLHKTIPRLRCLGMRMVCFDFLFNNLLDFVFVCSICSFLVTLDCSSIIAKLLGPVCVCGDHLSNFPLQVVLVLLGK